MSSLYQEIFGSLPPEFLDRPAITDDHRTVSYRELRALINNVAHNLHDAGFRQGDVLGLCLPNSIEFAAFFHGALRAGCVISPLHPASQPHDRDYQLQCAQAQQLFDASSVSDFLSPPAPGRPPLPFPLIKDTDLAVIPFSSGTTDARPRGVKLHHGNLVANIRQTLPRMKNLGLQPSWPMLAPLPFSHIYGLTVELNMALAHGNHILTMERFSLPSLGELAERYQAKWLSVAPPILLALRSALHSSSQTEVLAQFKSLEVVLSGAAPLDGHLAADISKKLNAQVVQGYGLTEASPVTHVSLPHQEDPASAGVPVADTEVKVTDPHQPNRLVPPGELGEMWVRGPQVMSGYINGGGVDPEGWLATGDIVKVDEHGFTWIIDRAKELIFYHGYQVPPAELEAVMLSHPGVAAAAATSGYDSQGQEFPRAFVVRADNPQGKALTENDVISWVASRVTPYKKVRQVDFVDHIPVSASGKILRRLLRDKP
ncbi:AMP-binding protein [Corynebacterium sp. 3HC-13]|uniref:AMP-binding protein n=1 Tax=Corynebacterium poyangense TaxID=2684405 RepID=UPI001CCDB927|nr:AMP-binding protein [Corynebacterium poyangense]MBZ8178308.1 AMP-binding protein [Corynebacterium poyangense]